jgi:hypothetical protein
MRVLHCGQVIRVTGEAFHWLRLLPVRDFGCRRFCATRVPPQVSLLNTLALAG